MSETIDSQGFPYLDLRKVPPIFRLWRAISFIETAKIFLASNGLTARYSITYRDCQSVAIGISPWPLTYPVDQRTIARLEPIIIKLEDRNFWKHHGIDYLGVLRATYQNISALRIVQGASTLTQQLVRNTFIFPSKSIVRKIVELILAIHIENKFSKQEILNAYCGFVHLGPGIRGFDAALRIYHRQTIAQASESTLRAVAGCLRAPMRTSPLIDSAAYLNRTRQIEKILKTPTKPDQSAVRNPVRLNRLRQPRLAAIADVALLNVYGENSAIPTDIRSLHLTISSKYQTPLNALLKAAFSDPDVQHAAGLIVESRSGRVVAETSLFEGQDSHFSPAYYGKIQPGSTFKTFVLLEALEQGLSENTFIESSPFEWRSKEFSNGVWSVRNYRHQYRGLCTIEDAFINSDNTVFARLAEILGTEKIVRRMNYFKLLGPTDSHPSCALGAVTNGISLSQLVLAYGALSTGVRPAELTLIRAIEFYDGSLSSPKVPATDSYNLKSMYLLNSILARSGFVSGGKVIRGKSGTTRRGSVYVGYDDEMSYAVWLGFRKSRSEWWEKGAHAKSVLEKILDSISGRKFSLI